LLLSCALMLFCWASCMACFSERVCWAIAM